MRCWTIRTRWPKCAPIAAADDVIAAEMGEFDRPRAIGDLDSGLNLFGGQFLVMLSDGGTCTVETAARVPIRIGATTGDTSQILAGLSRGDSIVTVGQGGLKQGSRIKPVKL